MKRITLTIVLLVASLLGVIWVSQKPTSSKIGVIAPLSGIAASFGEDIQKGVMASGTGFQGVLFEDDTCEPATAVSVLNKLINIDKVTLIIGPACGSPQEAIVPILKSKDAVAVVPSAASKRLFSESGGNFFNLQYSLEKEAEFIAKSMYDRNLKRVVIVTYQNAFSKTVLDNFKINFKGEVVKEVFFVDGTSDISTEIAKLKELDFDAIVSTDITFFFVNGLQKLKQLEINVPVFAQYTVEIPAARPLVEGVFYSYPGQLSGNGGAVFELSKQAAQISVEATQKCGKDTSCIKKYLVGTGLFDSDGVSKREIILKQIKEGRAVVL